MEYPRYISHKEVSAAKISVVDPGADGSLTLHLEGGFDSVVIPHQDVKHKPRPAAGWYLIQYADGYISFSPEDVFEEGYTLLKSDVASENAAATLHDSLADTHADEIEDAANDHGQLGTRTQALPVANQAEGNEAPETSTEAPPAVVA